MGLLGPCPTNNEQFINPFESTTLRLVSYFLRQLWVRLARRVRGSDWEGLHLHLAGANGVIPGRPEPFTALSTSHVLKVKLYLLLRRDSVTTVCGHCRDAGAIQDN